MDHTKRISVVRVPDTPAHNEVANYIFSTLNQSGLKVEWDEFEDNTPLGKKRFRNIIASINEDSDKTIVLAAHYDSKLFHDFKFVAATDSAASCAILLELAKNFKHSFPDTKEWGLKIVFFDGEEAFVDWTEEDSIYGARHLAKKWETQDVRGESMISRIKLFVLLDLLGYEPSNLYSLRAETNSFFDLLIRSEEHVRLSGLVKDQPSKNIFLQRRLYNFRVDDDHKPFMNRGVPIVHMIPAPFPPFWHSAGDTVDKLSLPVMKTLQHTLEHAVVTYVQDL